MATVAIFTMAIANAAPPFKPSRLIDEGIAAIDDDILRAADDIPLGAVCSFAADTPVSTDDGLVPIAEIEPGDEVLAYNEASDTIGFYSVSATWSHEDPITVVITIDGERIETTPEHPFFVEGQGWTAAGDVRTGQQVRDAGGEYDAVSAVSIESVPQAMYNLTVAEAHTYHVGGGQWLVHNDCDSLRSLFLTLDDRGFNKFMDGVETNGFNGRVRPLDEITVIIDEAVSRNWKLPHDARIEMNWGNDQIKGGIRHIHLISRNGNRIHVPVPADFTKDMLNRWPRAPKP